MRRRHLLKAFGAGTALALPGFVSAQPSGSARSPAPQGTARAGPAVPARDDTRAFHDTVTTASARGHFNGVARIDRARGRIEVHDYGADAFAEEHLFVPRAGARDGEGWLVGTVYDVPTRTTRVVVLDAARPAGGPVAEARLPYGVPLGLHGTFVRA